MLPMNDGLLPIRRTYDCLVAENIFLMMTWNRILWLPTRVSRDIGVIKTAPAALCHSNGPTRRIRHLTVD